MSSCRNTDVTGTSSLLTEFFDGCLIETYLNNLELIVYPI